MVEEHEIAKDMAAILNGDDSSTVLDDDFLAENHWRYVAPTLSVPELKYAKLRGMIAKLAMSRAGENHQDFETVLAETELKVGMEVAKILSKTIDPVLEALKMVVIKEENFDNGGHVCGVCQEEMLHGVHDVRAIGCMHIFHLECIYKWLKQKMVCPLCRYSPIEANKKKGQD